ncbi:SCP2 domain-containing protein [Pseudoxanthomonas broegbernensis]|uniref:Ubiquinone biosynthesis accessory factor UbiJ n=1 Tax=Pseudoxanthomonas broegbernensis TaxID=83619 RepID=A0A7V8GNB9_9GAMM|nr:SCP2 sterol-binding domain-containing protein [Pseudoxanthomonas broegbernensis]KAF1687000.1 SCP2 domain-containing protein [Pseudoxanthomonas broegbernensis]MBB6065384.1 ubiquinone biosynthesis protein UbiJ [Pseudoxanthomonas broegbernensis]
MSTPLDALKPLAGRALETALNRAVALDPDTRDALSAMDGRRVSLALEAPPLALDISVHGGHLQVGPPLREADLAVRGTLGGLLGQLPFFADVARGRPSGRLHMSGDADLARRLQRMAAGFDPDWQQPFVAAFGEVIGVQVANAAAAALRGARRTAAGLARSGAEYLTEEAREVVAAAELSAFHDDVDALRDDVERLAARVARLSAAERIS